MLEVNFELRLSELSQNTNVKKKNAVKKLSNKQRAPQTLKTAQRS